MNWYQEFKTKELQNSAISRKEIYTMVFLYMGLSLLVPILYIRLEWFIASLITSISIISIAWPIIRRIVTIMYFKD